MIIFNKNRLTRIKIFCDFLRKHHKGTALLFVIVGITMAAALGFGMFYMISASTTGQSAGSGMNRAYGLAMAGKDYALSNWDKISRPYSNEFSLSNSERFELTITDYEITSTGIVKKDTPFESRKEIKFAPPSPAKQHFLDTFENLTNWDTGNEVGTHKSKKVSDDKALQVKSSDAAFGSGIWSFLELKTGGGSEGIDLTPSWLNAGRCLSYDLQVKINNLEDYYMAGLNFKVAGIGDAREFYGVSYLRAKRVDGSDSDDIPSELKPDAIWASSTGFGLEYSKPAIILWKRQGGTFAWLAYKLLTNADLVVNASDNLVDWSNLQVRLIEAYPLDFENGGPSPLMSGAIVVGETSRAMARISGTPVITSGSWASRDVVGILTLTNISRAFSSGENLTVNGTILAKASGTLGVKTNFIRAYYGDADATNPDTSDIIPTNKNRKRSPRTEIHWPVDNVSDWKAENDFMTLVKWDDDVQAPALRLGGSGGDAKEENAIIKDSSLITPFIGAIDHSGIALHATGSSADSTYFDDFAVQY